MTPPSLDTVVRRVILRPTPTWKRELLEDSFGSRPPLAWQGATSGWHLFGEGEPPQGLTSDSYDGLVLMVDGNPIDAGCQKARRALARVLGLDLTGGLIFTKVTSGRSRPKPFYDWTLTDWNGTEKGVLHQTRTAAMPVALAHACLEYGIAQEIGWG